MSLPETDAQLEIPIQIDLDHRRAILGGEPMIFHCHHYNVFLQQTIQDAAFVDSRPFLVGAATDVAHHQLSTLFANSDFDLAARARMAADLYRTSGFGLVDLSTDGTIETASSHYATGWRAKLGRAEAPVCLFASGWIAGALAAIHDLPAGSFRVREESCAATAETAGGHCRFVVERLETPDPIFASAGVGTLSTHHPRPVPANNVDYDGILAAVGTLPLVGNDHGEIPAFGVYLTRHYANYYNRISFELERALVDRFGAEGIESAAPLLTEAGHVCAFNTLGGIMISTEWDALVRPTLASREDWVHGIVAVANALGWGRWQVTAVSEERAEFVIHDDYESVGYRAMYGQADHPVSYLAAGGVAGIMNLVYLGDIASKPELTEEFYQQLFKGRSVYRAKALSSIAMGDEVTSFEVTRS